MAGMEKLSTYLPTAIRQSIEDLRACRKDDRYELNMIRWHIPNGNGKCVVCLAGAVMAKRLGSLPDHETHPVDFIFTGEKANRTVNDMLFALNGIREGSVKEAIQRTGYKVLENIIESEAVYLAIITGQRIKEGEDPREGELYTDMFYDLDSADDELFEKDCVRMLELADILEHYEDKA